MTESIQHRYLVSLVIMIPEGALMRCRLLFAKSTDYLGLQGSTDVFYVTQRMLFIRSGPTVTYDDRTGRCALFQMDGTEMWATH